MDLGLELAGLECKWQVEIDEHAQRILEKHWPHVIRHDDVRTFSPIGPSWNVDLICGGFPCTDLSIAGKKAGLHGEQSSLWFEFRRIICLLEPSFVLVENVSALLFRGIDRVLRDLAELRYDAEWSCLPATAFGAPHVRNRLFLVAYSDGLVGSARLRVFDADDWDGPLSKKEYRKCAAAQRWDMASAPRISGVDDGISNGVERRRQLGNAVIPQVAEFIGRRLMKAFC